MEAQPYPDASGAPSPQRVAPDGILKVSVASGVAPVLEWVPPCRMTADEVTHYDAVAFGASAQFAVGDFVIQTAGRKGGQCEISKITDMFDGDGDDDGVKLMGVTNFWGARHVKSAGAKRSMHDREIAWARSTCPSTAEPVESIEG